jgi:dTDP-4-dehydrorhamnose reductase
MKLLVSGANGFLGHYLCELLLQKGHQVLATGRGPCRLPFLLHDNFSYSPMELTDVEQIRTVVSTYAPHHLIHAAAIGKPDECELNQPLATAINTLGTSYILAAANQIGAGICYVSTDFVFDGLEGNYLENSTRKPVNHYGQTKFEAELLVEQFPGKWSIVRTVLVYGRPMTGRDNLLTIVRDKLLKGERYQVVNDQVRTPTYVGDLAEGICKIIELDQQGIFHLSGEEILTPYEMATQAARYLELDGSLLIKTNSSQFLQPAKRPLVTGLNITKAKQVLGFNPINFETGLKKTFG